MMSMQSAETATRNLGFYSCRVVVVFFTELARSDPWFWMVISPCPKRSCHSERDDVWAWEKVGRKLRVEELSWRVEKEPFKRRLLLKVTLEFDLLWHHGRKRVRNCEFTYLPGQKRVGKVAKDPQRVRKMMPEIGSDFAIARIGALSRLWLCPIPKSSEFLIRTWLCKKRPQPTISH